MYKRQLRAGRGWANGVSPFESPERYAFLFFLAYIGIVTFTAARHGMTVLRFKADPEAAGTPAHRALAWANIAASVALLVFTALVRPETWAILLALSFIGLLQGRGILRYVSRPAASPRAWLVEHLSAMLAAGIAFHTAFAVFGATRFFGLTLTGPLAVLPWILPALLGIPATILWSRKYSRA